MVRVRICLLQKEKWCLTWHLKWCFKLKALENPWTGYKQGRKCYETSILWKWLWPGWAGRAGWRWARRQETAEVAGFCHGLDIRFRGQVMIRHRLSWKMDEETTSFQIHQLLSSGTHMAPVITLPILPGSWRGWAVPLQAVKSWPQAVKCELLELPWSWR